MDNSINSVTLYMFHRTVWEHMRFQRYARNPCPYETSNVVKQHLNPDIGSFNSDTLEFPWLPPADSRVVYRGTW